MGDSPCLPFLRVALFLVPLASSLNLWLGQGLPVRTFYLLEFFLTLTLSEQQWRSSYPSAPRRPALCSFHELTPLLSELLCRQPVFVRNSSDAIQDSVPDFPLVPQWYWHLWNSGSPEHIFFSKWFLFPHLNRRVTSINFKSIPSDGVNPTDTLFDALTALYWWYITWHCKKLWGLLSKQLAFEGWLPVITCVTQLLSSQNTVIPGCLGGSVFQQLP